MRSIIICMLLAAPMVVSCASDPNKKLKEARTEEAEAAREQQEKRIDQAKDQRVKSIEQRADQMENQAGALPQGSEQRAKAQGDMAETRQLFMARAQARLHKAEARLEEARRKLQIAGGRVPTDVHDRANLASRQTSSVANDLGHLPLVTNDRWTDETKRIESRLDEVEKSVDDVSSKANDYSY